MQKHSSFIPKLELHQTFSELIENMREKHSKLGDICYIYDKEGLKLAETDTYQFFISNLLPKTPVEKVFYEMLVRTMYQMEVKSGGSAYFVFSYALNLMEQLLKNEELVKTQESVLHEDLETFFASTLKPIFESSFAAINDTSLKQYVDSYTVNNRDLGCAVHESLILSGLEGKIFVESGKQSNYIVELKNGYVFKSVEPFKFLLDNETSWVRNNVRMMVIDGIVEEVAELDQLLNKASEIKQPLLIVAMGFGEEIAATCKANNDKGKFDVQLAKFTNDVWSLNVANDIAIVCGTTPISSMQGHVVAFVNWDELPVVDKVHVGLKEISIENRNTQTNVLMHMKTIIERKNNANTLVEDIQNIYDARLKSLASNSVYLYLPLVSEIENKSLRITIDNILRNVKTLLNYGTLNEVSFLEKLNAVQTSTDLDKMIKKTLGQTIAKQQKVPLLTAALGTYLVTKMCLMLIGSNGLICSHSQASRYSSKQM